MNEELFIGVELLALLPTLSQSQDLRANGNVTLTFDQRTGSLDLGSSIGGNAGSQWGTAFENDLGTISARERSLL